MLKRKTLSPQEEAVLHEKVARMDSHEAQTKGIVGWFYRFYIEATVQFVEQSGGLVLDVGSGEGISSKNLACTQSSWIFRSLGSRGLDDTTTRSFARMLMQFL